MKNMVQVDENNKDTYVTCVECNKKMTQITHTHVKSCHGLRNTKEYMDKHNLTKEHLYCKAVRELRKVTLENMVKKYGKEEGERRWKQYKDKQAYSNSFEYKQKKHGWSKEDYDRYNSIRASTKSNFIKRHGLEKGVKKWNDYVSRQRYAGVTEDYFKEKYGQIEGSKKFKELCSSKKNTLETFVARYGEEIGTERWKQYGENRSRYMRQSNMATELFWSIMDMLPAEEHDSVFFHDKNQEYFLARKGYKTMFLDFYHAGRNKVIEFAGDYWHGNPTKYNSDFFVPQANTTAGVLYEKTLERNKIIENVHGCKVLLVWENDYKANMDKIAKKCLDFLLND